MAQAPGSKIMSILPFQLDWLSYIKNIDIKSSHWPWCDESWEDISKYIIRLWWDGATPKGFSVFQFTTQDFIPISKITVHPKYWGQGIGSSLLRDIEATARKHGVSELRIIVWEYDEDQIKWLFRHGFKLLRSRGKYPDGSNSYEFSKKVK